MLREGRIHLLGSDCHDLKRRTPNLGAALELIVQRLGPSALREIHSCEKMIFCPSENHFE
jgi:tyrosine-protein phosphatase YwqE